MKKQVKGIEGYADVTQKFIEATMAIDFYELQKEFIPFLPRQPSCILDIGAGIGRDAAAFSAMGHSVVAVEPTDAYRAAGQRLFDSKGINWIDDSWPQLERLGEDCRFDFVLASGVMHHLDASQQHEAMVRISGLLNNHGILALSLRNGPAGVGTCVFPTNSATTMESAGSCGLKLLLRMDGLPSLMKNKQAVTW